MTNAGKTYTISGKGDGDNVGLLPRALATIFESLQPAAAFTVLVSYIEIYNEVVTDLLAVPTRGAGTGAGGLHISVAKGDRPYVQGAQRVVCASAADALRAMKSGQEKKKVRFLSWRDFQLFRACARL